MDPLKIFIHLNEETGEIAKELKKTWSKNYEAFDRVKLAAELADVQVCICALANQFDIDIESAVEEKFIKADGKRKWKTAIEKKGDSHELLS